MTTGVEHGDEFRAGRELGLNHVKLGMWLFLASEVMFFGGLISAFLHYKLNNPSLESGLLDVLLVGGNTFVLLTSSYTVVMALAAARAGNPAGLVRNLLLTAVLGAAFLAGQGYEFASLIREGMTPTSSVFGSSFFTLTGFHGLHVLVGLLWALRNLAKALRGGFDQGRRLGVEIFGLYWHFVDIVWIVLFTVIYLI
ncbi:MAG TPA: heme-copper oxidase subunit III [Anaerolineales bacterium]|nr:heme-copper oxidase subunit III [Anaerolineales bacterium]